MEQSNLPTDKIADFSDVTEMPDLEATTAQENQEPNTKPLPFSHGNLSKKQIMGVSIAAAIILAVVLWFISGNLGTSVSYKVPPGYKIIQPQNSPPRLEKTQPENVIKK